MAVPEFTINVLNEAFTKRKPESAIAYMQSKGLALSDNSDEVIEAVKKNAFTVAQIQSMDLLDDIKNEITKAIKNGSTFEEFQKAIKPRLQDSGWASSGGNIGSRLQTIFRTNIQQAYMEGRIEGQIENKENRPYLMYVATLDPSTRSTHRSRNGSIAKIDSNFWKKWYPSNGYRCRCTTRALTEKQAKARGIGVKGFGNPDPGFESGPDKLLKADFRKYDKKTRALGKKLKPRL